MTVKCDFCGENNAERMMDSGAWICKRCVKKLGGYNKWDDSIKYMGRAETYEAIHSRPDKVKGAESIARERNAPIRKTVMICLFLVIVSCAQTFIEWTDQDTRYGICGLVIIACVLTIIIVPTYVIIKQKRNEMREKKQKEERLRQEDELTKRQVEFDRQKEEFAKQQNEFTRQREDLNRRRMEFEQYVIRERNRQMNEEFARRRQSEEDERRHWKSTDEMTGIQFEQYCAMELKRDCGFVRVEFTKTSGDYGGDLVGYHKDGSKWVIQCKRYRGHVGIDAVQEVLGAKSMYDADKMAVMTNSLLTASARELAKKSGVLLIENIKGTMRFA